MPPAADKRPFPRREHVKSSAQIKRILDEGESVYAYPIKCYYLVSEEATARARLAVMTPKRRFPRAVDRNRLKRLMRECFRLHKGLLDIPDGKCCSLCWIAVARTMPTFEEVRKAVVSLFQSVNDNQKTCPA